MELLRIFGNQFFKDFFIIIISFLSFSLLRVRGQERRFANRPYSGTPQIGKAYNGNS